MYVCLVRRGPVTVKEYDDFNNVCMYASMYVYMFRYFVIKKGNLYVGLGLQLLSILFITMHTHNLISRTHAPAAEGQCHRARTKDARTDKPYIMHTYNPVTSRTHAHAAEGQCHRERTKDARTREPYKAGSRYQDIYG